MKNADESRGPSRLRRTSSWFGPSGKEWVGVVLSEEKTLDGRPVGGDEDQATLLVSATPS